MKLASLKAGRDGRLFVVSSDLRRATDAFAVASTLQSALDDWDRISPKLADLAEALEEGTAGLVAYECQKCAYGASVLAGTKSCRRE
jgi:fumarylacetoacetate (FAA) hydrolase